MQDQSCSPIEHFIKFSSWISLSWKIFPIKWHVEVETHKKETKHWHTPHAKNHTRKSGWESQKKNKRNNHATHLADNPQLALAIGAIFISHFVSLLFVFGGRVPSRGATCRLIAISWNLNSLLDLLMTKCNKSSIAM